MSTEVVGFQLLIVGCPVGFCTPGVSTATSGDALWFTPTSWSELLEWPQITINEQAKPLDGDLDVSGFQLELLDDTSLSALFARDATNNVSSPVTVSVTALAASITVQNGALYTNNTDAWIERECVGITAIAGNVLTTTRGKYGSQAVAHTIDAANNRNPELFASQPWLGVQRHAYLFAVRSAGTAFCVWEGQIKRPVLEAGMVKIQCEHLWSTIRNLRIGEYYGGTDLIGLGVPVNSPAVVKMFYNDSTLTAWEVGGASSIYRTTVDCLNDTASNLARVFGSGHGLTASSDVVRLSDGAYRFRLRWLAGADNGPSGVLFLLGNDPINGQFITNGTTRVMDFNVPAAQSCAYMVGNNSVASQDFYFSGSQSLPVIWDGSTVTGDGRSTRGNRVLRGVLNEDWYVVFNSVVVNNSTRKITAKTSFCRRNPSADEAYGFGSSLATITQPHLTVALQVACDHWAEGFEFGIIPELGRDTWSAHWDFSTITNLVRHTAYQGARRVSYYDSESVLGEILSQDCILSGCSPVIRASGRIALWCWKIPDAQDTIAATYTSDSLISDESQFELFEEGLANSIEVTAKDFRVVVNLSQSLERYGRGREMKVDLKGIDADRIRSIDPIALKNNLLRRLQLWSEPIYVVKLEVPIDQIETVYTGDVISITEWSAPDGAGNRGLSSAKGVVWNRTLDFANGKIRLECLLFGRVSYPYSPCVVTTGIDGTGKIVNLKSNPLNGSTAYDGTSGSGYSRFAVGNFVQLTQRDSTTPLTESAKITALTPGAPDTMTFFAALSAPMQAIIASGSWVTVRYDAYATVTSTQRSAYAFVGDDTTGVIGGTSVQNQLVAP